MPDCEDSVLIHEAVDAVERMLPEPVPLFSKSPVLLCFRIFSPDNKPFFVFSTKLFRRCGGSSDLALRTKPPRESSTRWLRFSAGSGVGAWLLLPSLLRNDVKEALIDFGRNLDAKPNGADCRTP
mgnify:CR=1 FL=1